MAIYTKCIVIGDIGVGKSSIIMRYTNNIYTPHDPTIGVDYMTKHLQYMGHPIKLCIWDASGYPSYRSIVRSYYKHINQVILVFDVTNRDSFDNLDIWLEDVKTHSTVRDMVLVGNKVDDRGHRDISFEQGDKYARKNGMLYIETSAKDNLAIDAIFSRHIHNRYVFETNDQIVNSHTPESNERCICSCSLNRIYEWLLSVYDN